MESTDKELLLACRGGDEVAWEALVNRYQRLIYAIPRRAGLDDDQSADVFQEVFTTLFQKLDAIDQPERLHAWLVTTTKRKTWRQVIKQKETVSVEDEGVGQEFLNLPDGAPLPEEDMLRLEQQHSIRAAIAALDDRCHKLITMLFYETEAPAYADIAASLGTTEGSIGPTRARCLAKLQRLLEK
jgi:RNA polymerase sigma factor (sigma-70 family)